MDVIEEEAEGSTSVGSGVHPRPEKFDLFIPWACRQLQLNIDVIITNVLSKTESKLRSRQSLAKSKNKKSKAEIFSGHDMMKTFSFEINPIFYTDTTIKLTTVYDSIGNLIQLKFDQNKNIPRELLKLIGLILHFHKYLSSILINRGLNKGLLHELSILVSNAYITDICLDNTFIGDGGYEILLENRSCLRYLSLSRCRLQDDTVEKMASKLTYPLPASISLSLLNLASNCITDKGATCLASALRTNRTIIYLNISDNAITDAGACAILDVLNEFPVLDEELLEYRRRHHQYLKEKNKLKSDIIKQLSLAGFEKKDIKKKCAKLGPSNNLVNSEKGRYHREPGKGRNEVNEELLEKAEVMANAKLGEFKDPLSKENTVTKNNNVYCKGNNSLAYINFSYNDLAYFTVKKMLSILEYQKKMNRKPRGIVNIYIEGNNIPLCTELNMIDNILTSYLPSYPKKMTVAPNAIQLRGKK